MRLRPPFEDASLINELNVRIAAAQSVGYMGQEERASALALVVCHQMRTVGTAAHESSSADTIHSLVVVIDTLAFPAD